MFTMLWYSKCMKWLYNGYASWLCNQQQLLWLCNHYGYVTIMVIYPLWLCDHCGYVIIYVAEVDVRNTILEKLWLSLWSQYVTIMDM